MWEGLDGELPGKAPYKGLVPTTRRRLAIPLVAPAIHRNCSRTPTLQPPALRGGLPLAVWRRTDLARSSRPRLLDGCIALSTALWLWPHVHPENHTLSGYSSAPS
jgi:hypothetical protein